MKENIILLKTKFDEIYKKGWIKSVNSGTGSVGLTFEKSIGKEKENFEWPDYEGIEIKTKTFKKNKCITLFNAAPDGEYLFETKRLWEKYGYPSKENKNKKIFYATVSTKDKKYFYENYSAKLEIDERKERLYLCIYNKEILVDRNSFWTFELLKEKLYRKLKYLAVVDAIKKKENNNEYFKYQKITFYKLKNFEFFLKLVRYGEIKVKFAVSIYSYGNKIGTIHDHGTSFSLDEIDILDLFDKILLQ